MSEDSFPAEDWFLAGSISKGLGRSYLITARSLSEIEPDEWHQSASSFVVAKRWLREQLGGVPVKWHRGSKVLVYCYVRREHVEMP